MLGVVARVVVVHGINNTFSSSPQMEQAWGPALLGGVELAAGRQKVLSPDDVAYVFYGDVFRPPGRFLDGELPLLTADDVEDGLETELLLSWWQAAARVEPGVVPPDARTLGAMSTARAALLALAGSRWLARVSERMLVWWVKQVTAYFTREEIRAAVQQRFAAVVDRQTRVVVGHSLGSVVAYEALCADPAQQDSDLVTLGSPLGVPHIVLHRLTPQPQAVDGRLVGQWPGVQRWVNITDAKDFVALQPRLRSVFGARVVDVEITTGMSAHQVERYLSATETGAAVLAGLGQAG
jgi:hypothetical protein